MTVDICNGDIHLKQLIYLPVTPAPPSPQLTARANARSG